MILGLLFAVLAFSVFWQLNNIFILGWHQADVMLVFNKGICLKWSNEFKSVYIYHIGKTKNKLDKCSESAM